MPCKIESFAADIEPPVALGSISVSLRRIADASEKVLEEIQRHNKLLKEAVGLLRRNT